MTKHIEDVKSILRVQAISQEQDPWMKQVKQLSAKEARLVATTHKIDYDQARKNFAKLVRDRATKYLSLSFDKVYPDSCEIAAEMLTIPKEMFAGEEWQTFEFVRKEVFLCLQVRHCLYMS